MPAGKLMPFLYVSVPISSLIGWIFWHQQLSYFTVIGTIFVVMGVTFIMFESKIKQMFRQYFKGKLSYLTQ
jgi:drug/metabolite transporter (DMT)-like permease